ncbi:hypothetical protein BKA69DRAFT_1060840 [Paraphysoderma sedebokerense]|nr:hypothetical protein BKA69DRAFT_1060840 [Paraphysoderma sedebokerense]
MASNSLPIRKRLEEPSSTTGTANNPEPKSVFKSHPTLFLVLGVQAFALTYYPELYPTVREALAPPVFFPEVEGSVPHERFLKHPILTYGFHIFPLYIWAPGAIFQVASGFNHSRLPARERKQSKWHRLFGYVWMVSSVSIGISAFGMVCFDVTSSFPLTHHTIFTMKLLNIVLASWFLCALIKAYMAAIGHNVRNHQKWILRHVFAGLTVGLARWVIGFYSSLCVNGIVPWHGCKPGIQSHNISAYDHKIVFAACSWFSLVIALSMGEIAVRRVGLLEEEDKSQ